MKLRQIYTLMPWWAAAPAIGLAALTLAILGAKMAMMLAMLGLCIAAGGVTLSKYRQREEDRIARIVYFAHPDRTGHQRMYDLLVGQMWLGFAAIVIFASLGAAVFGPLGALVPAGVLAARNILGRDIAAPRQVPRSMETTGRAATFAGT